MSFDVRRWCAAVTAAVMVSGGTAAGFAADRPATVQPASSFSDPASVSAAADLLQPVADSPGSTSCGCSAANHGSGCCSYGPDTWVQVEGLSWWIKGNRVPALVTTSPPGTLRTEAGVLGPGLDTTVLFGNGAIDEVIRFGGRVNVGHWLGADHLWALEGHWFSLGDGANSNYFNQSTGDPILARPFFNSLLDAEDSQLVAFPDVVEGSISVTTNSEMHSAGALLRRHVYEDDCTRVAMVGGYRYLRFREALAIREDLVSTDPAGVVAIGTTFDVLDRFATQNDFHGGEIGLAVTFDRDAWALDVLAKLGLGNIHRELDISGSTLVTVPGGGTAEDVGGLLALSSNIGNYSSNAFGFLPQLDVNFRYYMTDRLSVSAGYSLLYVTNVFRSGDQIDISVNPSQIPFAGGVPVTDPPPEPLLNETSLWAQGVNFGVMFEF